MAAGKLPGSSEHLPQRPVPGPAGGFSVSIEIFKFPVLHHLQKVLEWRPCRHCRRGQNAPAPATGFRLLTVATTTGADGTSWSLQHIESLWQQTKGDDFRDPKKTGPQRPATDRDRSGSRLLKNVASNAIPGSGKFNFSANLPIRISMPPSAKAKRNGASRRQSIHTGPRITAKALPESRPVL